MLRRVSFALLGVCVLVPAADAADLGGSLKDQPVYVAPFTWTGFYIGANAGYGWDNGHARVTPLPNAATFIYLEPQTFDPDIGGALGGAQTGYNWQMGKFIFGVEADIQGAGIDGTADESPIIMNSGLPLSTGGHLFVKQQLDWFGTARVRAGMLAFNPRAMLYATGGLAFGNIKNTANADFPAGVIWGHEQFPASFSDTQTGWVIGGGLEMAMTNNWSFKLEYLHLDFGSKSATVNAVPALAPYQINYDFDSRVDIVRAGINYKFR